VKSDRKKLIDSGFVQKANGNEEHDAEDQNDMEADETSESSDNDCKTELNCGILY
jgi:hypothetical protein